MASTWPVWLLVPSGIAAADWRPHVVFAQKASPYHEQSAGSNDGCLGQCPCHKSQPSYQGARPIVATDGQGHHLSPQLWQSEGQVAIIVAPEGHLFDAKNVGGGLVLGLADRRQLRLRDRPTLARA